MKRSPLRRRTPLRSRGERGCAPTPAKCAAHAASPSAVLRNTPLRPGTVKLARRTPLAAVNPERAAAKYERNFGSHADFIRAQKCLVPGCHRKGQAAHVRPRQMGGCGGDWRELVPLCGPYGHHEEQEGRNREFEARHGLNLAAEAARYVILDPEVAEEERAAARVALREALASGLACPWCPSSVLGLYAGALSCVCCGADSISDPLFTDRLAAIETVAAELEIGLKTLRAVVCGKPKDLTRLWAALAGGGLA